MVNLKSDLVNIRLPESTMAMIDELIRLNGYMNRTDCLRYLVRKEFEYQALHKND